MLASIYLIGIAQGLLLFLFFIKQAKKDPSFYLLTGLILAITLMIACQWMITQQLHLSLWPLFLFSTGLVFIIGPLLYLYIRLKVKGEKKDILRLSPHFIPAALYFIALMVTVFPFSEQQVQEMVLGSTLPDNQPHFPLFGIIKLFHLLIYTLLSFKIINPKRNDREIRPFWYFILGYIVLQGVAWLMISASIFGDSTILHLADHIISIILVVYVYILGYLSMESPDFLANSPIVFGKKYKTTGLDPDSSSRYFGQLTQLMRDQKPYLDPGLNLQGLAGLLSIKPHHLSQVINENAGTNFSDFVNAYRVETVKEYLTESQYSNYTLLAIALEAGFNNKNSFNSAFKKHVGKTPTDYRKALC